MATYDVISELCKNRNLAITALERELGFGRGSIGKLRTGNTTLNSQESGPASFDGNDIPEDDRELFAAQLEAMLTRLKKINKELYNPNKNKK